MKLMASGNCLYWVVSFCVSLCFWNIVASGFHKGTLVIEVMFLSIKFFPGCVFKAQTVLMQKVPSGNHPLTFPVNPSVWDLVVIIQWQGCGTQHILKDAILLLNLFSSRALEPEIDFWSYANSPIN